MMKKRNYSQISFVATLPILLVLTGCFEDQNRRMLVRNNNGDIQQPANTLGDSGRASQNRTSLSPNWSQTPPVNTNTTTPQTVPTKKTGDETTVSSQATFVVKPPMAPSALCSQALKSSRAWGRGGEVEFVKDDIDSKCKAEIMAARYKEFNDTEVDFREYSAIHPQRANGFLVAGVKFDKMKQITRTKSEDKETKKQERQNRRNSGIDASGLSGYSKKVWKRIAELKNSSDGELDAPAVRRLFFGLDGADKPIQNHDDLKPAFLGVDRKLNDVLIAKHHPTVELKFGNTTAVEGSTLQFEESSLLQSSSQGQMPVGFVKGGAIETVPMSFSNDGSVQSLSGFNKEFSNQTQDGSNVIVYETNIVHDHDLSLAIGHYVETKGDEILYSRGSQTGTFMVLVDGQKMLYQLDSLKNRTTALENKLEAKIDGKTGDCRSTNIVLIYIPRSDKENDRERARLMAEGKKPDLSISESLFFSNEPFADKKVYQPLHQGIISTFPVKKFDSPESLGNRCKNHFFSNDVLEVKMDGIAFDGSYMGDTYVHIDEINATKVGLSIFGLNPDEFSIKKEKITFGGTNVKGNASNLALQVENETEGLGIVQMSLTGSIATNAQEDAILSTLTVEENDGVKHRWDGRKVISSNSRAATEEVVAR